MELGLLIPAMQSLDAVLQEFSNGIKHADPDFVWVSDRILANVFHPDLLDRYDMADFNQDCWLDPFVTIAAMSAVAKKTVSYGIAVTDLIRRSPVDLARTTFTLSQLLERPFNIGFGAGEAENLVPVGYELGETPVARMEEGIRIFKEIMETGLYSHPGRQRKVNLGYQSSPGHIWLGGQGPRMLRIAARYAEGWLPAWKMSADEYAAKSDTLVSLSDQFKRRPPKRGMFGALLLGRSKKDIFAAVERNPMVKLISIILSGEQWKKWGLEHPCGENSKGMFDVIVRDLPAASLAHLAPSIPVETLDDFHFIGNAEEVLAELEPYRQAGLEQLVVSNSSFLIMNRPQERAEAVEQFGRICREIRSW